MRQHADMDPFTALAEAWDRLDVHAEMLAGAADGASAVLQDLAEDLPGEVAGSLLVDVEGDVVVIGVADDASDEIQQFMFSVEYGGAGGNGANTMGRGQKMMTEVCSGYAALRLSTAVTE